MMHRLHAATLGGGWTACLLALFAWLPSAAPAETIWADFSTNPIGSTWAVTGTDADFLWQPEGWMRTRVHRTEEQQRFTHPLAQVYDETQEFWLEYDYRAESVYEWPRGYLGLMHSGTPDNNNILGIFYQRRNLSTAEESLRGIARRADGNLAEFSTTPYSRPIGTEIDARVRLHYWRNAGGEGWMTITITNLATGAVISTGEGRVLQAGQTGTYDQLGISAVLGARNSSWLDRIRLDNLYFSTVQSGDEHFIELGEERPAPSWVTDQQPPTPDPMTFEVAPHAAAATRVAMTATLAVDDQFPVQYQFENVDIPDRVSLWQAERTWTDTGLTPETTYHYRVRARDMSPNRNVTDWSDPLAATTPAETDTNPPEPNPPAWQDEPAVIGANRIIMTAGTVTDSEGNGPVQYFFANITDPSLDSGWQVDPTFEAARLPYNTSYTWRFKARDTSGNFNETGWSAEVTVTTGPEPLFEDLVRLEGTWPAPGVGQPLHYRVYHQSGTTPLRAPVVIYMLNLPMERIGTEADASILGDMIDDGYIVIAVDLQEHAIARHPILDGDMDLFRRAVIGYQTTTLLQGTNLLADDEDIYFVPSGWRLERGIAYWDLARHGAYGSLSRVLSTYNGHVVTNRGATPVTDVADIRGPSGEEIDYNLYLDIVYPSNPAQPVPLLFDSATQSNRMRAYRPATGRIHHIGTVLNGMAWGIVDHCWNPLARDYHYGYWDGGYTMEDWNGVASITAAVRYFKAHAGALGIDPDLIGGMGHSKGSYTITRLADPDNAGAREHFRFSGQPEGSPEPQPWPGFTSTIRASYQSMGNGTRRTQYITADFVPTMVACGIFDEYNQWLVFPDLVAPYEANDLNHVAFWMTDLGHTLPRNLDPIFDRDRYALFFQFFRAHLRHANAAAPEVLYVLPAATYGTVTLRGTNRYIPADNLLVAGKEHMTEREGPIAVQFAPDVDAASANAGGLNLVRLRDGSVVPGTWVASRGNSRLSFIPDGILPDHEDFEIRVNPSLTSTAGVPFVGAEAFAVRTGSLSAAYDAWAESFPDLPADGRGVFDDPFGLGLPNLLAYALDADPAAPDGALLPTAMIAGEGAGLQLSLSFPLLREELEYQVEYSHDLVGWSTEGVTLEGPVDGRMHASVPIAEDTAAFLRLRVGAAASIP